MKILHQNFSEISLIEIHLGSKIDKWFFLLPSDVPAVTTSTAVWLYTRELNNKLWLPAFSSLAMKHLRWWSAANQAHFLSFHSLKKYLEKNWKTSHLPHWCVNHQLIWQVQLLHYYWDSYKVRMRQESTAFFWLLSAMTPRAGQGKLLTWDSLFLWIL